MAISAGDDEDAHAVCDASTNGVSQHNQEQAQIGEIAGPFSRPLFNGPKGRDCALESEHALEGESPFLAELNASN